LDSVILTHAHLDHTGRLPLLIKQGYSNPIFATPATIEMTALVLNDSVRVQSHDLKRSNRKRLRSGQSPLSALYSEEEVVSVLGLLKPVFMNSPWKLLRES